MKRELTLPDIVGYLPYGLYCWYGENIKAALMAGITDYQIPIFEVGRKPILRPMSDLFVKITERGYNDGKPFVPIMELVNLIGDVDSFQWRFQPENRRVFSREYSWCFQWDFESRAFVLHDSPSEYVFGNIIPCMHNMYDLLHRLHFDYRGLIPAGLAVSVHDLLTNPYEA